MKKLGFIGGGNMAEALARGLLERKIFKPAELIVSDVDAGRRRKIKGALKIAVTDDNLEVVRESRAVLLAVKPQQIDEVLTGVASADKIRLKDKLFISIAAGITIARLTGVMGAKARVIRVMPNAPAMVGRGSVTRSGYRAFGKRSRVRLPVRESARRCRH
jgi:pyrroline-5-carboxylate reductase